METDRKNVETNRKCELENKWKRTENMDVETDRKCEKTWNSNGFSFLTFEMWKPTENGYSVGFHIFSVRFPFCWDLSLLVSWSNGFRVCSLDFHQMLHTFPLAQSSTTCLLLTLRLTIVVMVRPFSTGRFYLKHHSSIRFDSCKNIVP